MTKAYHSDNLVYYLGIFAANKANFTWFVTLTLGLDALTFRMARGAYSVIPFKCACALKLGAPLSGGLGYTANIKNFTFKFLKLLNIMYVRYIVKYAVFEVLASIATFTRCRFCPD